MGLVIQVYALLPLLSLQLTLACPDGECRELAFPSFFFFANKRLVNHNITTIQVRDMDACELFCYEEPNCVSINFEYKASTEGIYRCELNNATHIGHVDEFEEADAYLYRGADSACDTHRCDNGGTCQSGFTDKGYRCLCPPGFMYAHCRQDVDECAYGRHGHSCSLDAVCSNTYGSYECKCNPGYTGDGFNCTDINECREDMHNCSADSVCINTNGSFRCSVPDPVVYFPLNISFGTNEINNRVTHGVPGDVSFAQGPNGEANGSYEFKGTQHSFIVFPNNPGGALDVRHSMTVLCWLYYDEKDGPVFNYRTTEKWGVVVRVQNKKFHVRFRKRDYSSTRQLKSPTPFVARAWTFVGATYNSTSGEAKMWIDGQVVNELNIGSNLQLGTQDNVTMGVRGDDPDFFKGRITQMQVYNVPLTHDEIQKVKGKIKRSGAVTASCILGGLDNKYLDELNSYLAPVLQSSSRSSFVRCWHAKTDGWEASTFHSNCDEKGPTVTIIQVEKYIFGGYTDVSWSSPSPGKWDSSSKSFVYSLYNINGYAPVKLQIKSELTNYAIYRCYSNGPSFGINDFGIAMKQSSNVGCNRNSYAYCCKTYPLPQGYSTSNYSLTFYAGNVSFTPTDVEVFYETTT